MKYSYDTYSLYKDEKRFAFVVRAKVRMKETVDIDVLRVAANKAIKRYPYFAVKIDIDENGAYVRIPNDKEIAVLKMGSRTPDLCSEEVNGHLLFLECDGRDIFFNISHTMCGGRGLQPWIMTTLWQYIADRYGIEPNAPSIRKPGEPLLDGETEEPSLDKLTDEEPVYEYKSQNPTVLAFDYMNGLFNPFARNNNYRVLTFEQKDIMTFAKGNDSSVAAFFLIVFLCAYSDSVHNKFRVEAGREVFTSSGGVLRRQGKELVREGKDLEKDVAEPVFFETLDGKVRQVQLVFTSLHRTVKTAVKALVVLFLPVIIALFLNGFDFQRLELGGSAVWFCIMVPVVPVYLLKFSVIERYERPLIYVISENGSRKRYRKKTDPKEIWEIVKMVLKALFIPPACFAIWFGIICFLMCCYLTAVGFD